MNLLTPVSKIMTSDLITASPQDSLQTVKEKFEAKRIHHIPVVEFRKIVGIISKSDLLYFLKGIRLDDKTTDFANEARMMHFTAADIMTSKLAKLEPNATIATALEVFKENLFHALPIVENDELVGILTTYDIISTLADDKIQLSDYETASV